MTDDKFVTLYLTDAAYKRAEEHFDELEDVAKREIALVPGHNAINVDTASRTVVDRVRAWFGEENVLEVAR